MSAHLHVVILYIIAMQIINLQSTTRMYQNIFRSSLHFFNKSEIIQITFIYNFKKVNVMCSFLRLFLCLFVTLASVRFGQLLCSLST